MRAEDKEISDRIIRLSESLVEVSAAFRNLELAAGNESKEPSDDCDNKVATVSVSHDRLSVSTVATINSTDDGFSSDDADGLSPVPTTTTVPLVDGDGVGGTETKTSPAVTPAGSLASYQLPSRSKSVMQINLPTLSPRRCRRRLSQQSPGSAPATAYRFRFFKFGLLKNIQSPHSPEVIQNNYAEPI